MQHRRHLIELIQRLSRQESSWQPTAEEWLREQDEKARDAASRAPGDPLDDRDRGAPDETP